MDENFLTDNHYSTIDELLRIDRSSYRVSMHFEIVLQSFI